MAVTKTVEESVVTIGGKEYPMTVTRYVGLSTYIGLQGEEILADEATYTDFGPKMGGGWSYTLHKEITPEENARARQQVAEVTTKAMIDQGFW